MTKLLKKKNEVPETVTSANPTLDARSLQQEITERAYKLFLKRGEVHGNDLDDWLKAEREVLAKVKPEGKNLSQTSGFNTSRRRSAK